MSICNNLDEAGIALQAQDQENSCRKDLTKSERADMVDRLKAALRPMAAANSVANLQVGKSPGAKGSPSGLNQSTRASADNQNDPNGPDKESGRIESHAAKIAGIARDTYRKATAVKEAAKTDPVAAEIADEMGKTDNVEKAYKQLQERRRTTKKDILLDQLQVPVPDHLRDLFGDPMLSDCVEKLDGVVKELKSIRRQVVGKGDAWKFLLASDILKSLDATLAELEVAKAHLQAATPHAVCPLCKGAGCNDCRQSGWLPRWRVAELKNQGVI